MICRLVSRKKSAKKIIQEALKVLGKKNLALIIHGSSFPSIESEDTGFGNPNSQAARDLIDFAAETFDNIQLGPSGKTKLCDSSPYTGTIFSVNPLFIDLKQLTTKEWGKILSEETFNKIVKNNPNRNKGKTSYSYIYKEQNFALEEAYENFKSGKKFQKEFERFKSENRFWLDKDALYEALSIEYNNDYWPQWPSDMDKYLFNPRSIEEKMECGERINELEKKYAKAIDSYAFVQFVAHKQMEETIEYANSKGIKMIADRQVAFSDRDIWAYNSIFLKDWLLGCPPDYFSKDGQAWGFPVLDPEQLFTADGSLGEGGKVMKALFKKMFKENQGGVRIDHIVGLIDPWVYKKGQKPKVEDGAGRLYSSPEHSILSKFAIATIDDINTSIKADSELKVERLTDEQVEKYGRIIEKIVIEAAKEEGLDKDFIVCEDLGTLTNPVAAVMEKYQLQGMKLTQFVVPENEWHPYRGKNIAKRSWAMVGTHDNQPASKWAKDLIHTHIGYLHAKNLAEDVYTFEDNKDDLIVKMTEDEKFLTQTKLTELFASAAENIQIFFTDYFGIKEVYNVPGTAGDKNWSLRLANNFKGLFCDNLHDSKAFNLPLALETAIKARGEDFAKKNESLINQLKELQV